MELGHIERRRGSGGVTGSWVALSGDGRGGHVQRGVALLVELALAVLVQRQRQALPLLSAVTEPNAHHLEKEIRSEKSPRQQQRTPEDCTHVSLQAQVVRDVRDLLRVGLRTLDEVSLQSRTHGSFQTRPALPLPGVHEHPLHLVHLQNSIQAELRPRTIS